MCQVPWEALRLSKPDRYGMCSYEAWVQWGRRINTKINEVGVKSETAGKGENRDENRE